MAPSTSEIKTIFHSLSTGDLQGFFAHVADNVDWTIMGHSPMSGHYTSKADFQARTLGVLNKNVLVEPLRMYVVNVVSDGEGGEGQAVVELRADSVCRNGLKYDMTYCWSLKFNEEGKIGRARAYLDTDLLTRAVEENK